MFSNPKDYLTLEYVEYMQSDTWKWQRYEALRIHGHVCAGCGRKDGLQVHHLRYGNFKDVKPATDLIPLCPPCHDQVHKSEILKSRLRLCKTINQKREALVRYLYAQPRIERPCGEAYRINAAYQEKVRKLKPNSNAHTAWHKYHAKPFTPIIEKKEQMMPLPDHGMVLVTRQNHKWLTMSKESYHWMLAEGIDPTKKKWNKRMIGREAPAKWFK